MVTSYNHRRPNPFGYLFNQHSNGIDDCIDVLLFQLKSNLINNRIDF